MSREGSLEIKYLYYGCIFQLAPDEDCCDEHCTRNCWKTPGTNGRGRLTSGEKPKISMEPLGIIKVLNVLRGIPLLFHQLWKLLAFFLIQILAISCVLPPTKKEPMFLFPFLKVLSDKQKQKETFPRSYRKFKDGDRNQDLNF